MFARGFWEMESQAFSPSGFGWGSLQPLYSWQLSDSHKDTQPQDEATSGHRRAETERTCFFEDIVEPPWKLILLLDCLVSEHFWILYDHLGEDLVSTLTETAEVIYTFVGHQPGMLKRLPGKRMMRMEIWVHYIYDYIQFWIPAIDWRIFLSQTQSPWVYPSTSSLVTLNILQITQSFCISMSSAVNWGCIFSLSVWEDSGFVGFEDYTALRGLF